MTNQQQLLPQQDQQPVDTSRHEESHGFNPEDVDILTAFTRRVSTELHKVDSQNVGSNSNIRAHQLEQKKILDGLKKTAHQKSVNKQYRKPLLVNNHNRTSVLNHLLHNHNSHSLWLWSNRLWFLMT